MRLRRLMAALALGPVALAAAAACATPESLSSEIGGLLLVHHADREAALGYIAAPEAGLPAFVDYVPPGDAETLARAREFAGRLGLTIYTAGDALIVAPYVDGALWRTGVREPLRLLQIAGYDTPDIAAAALLLGALDPTVEGSVELTVLRDGAPHRLRAPWGDGAPRLVDVFPLGRGGRLVRVYGFAATESAAALAEALAGAPSYVVLDLRVASGGSLAAMAAALGLFLPPQTLVARFEPPQEGRSALVTPSGGAPPYAGPLAVLVGPWTYSAAEVAALALQRGGRAKVLGSPSFGKCVAQAPHALSDGGILLIPEAEVLAADGVRCHAVGVWPDIVAENAQLADEAWLLSSGIALAIRVDYACAAVDIDADTLAALGRHARTSVVAFAGLSCLGPFADGDAAQAAADRLARRSGVPWTAVAR